MTLAIVVAIYITGFAAMIDREHGLIAAVFWPVKVAGRLIVKAYEFGERR